MDLECKIAALPDSPGVYLFKDATERVVYVGKARSLRQRVRSYFSGTRLADAKTGSLVREIADVAYIVADNEREALALENNLIKEYQPRFNVNLRDDKTYPYIKFTAGEKYPRVYVTRRVRRDGSIYFGPYFPARLAHRIVDLIHKRFLIPSCRVDLSRPHPRPCLQYYIRRCLGPCVPGLTTDTTYAKAARDARMFLEGRRQDLVESLRARMELASAEERFEQAAMYRDLIRTVEEIEERQKVAAAQGDDTDVIGCYAEPPQVAVNVFHVRNGRVVDRREFYWEDVTEFDAQEFIPALLKRLYLEADYVPRLIHTPVDFEDREVLEELLRERTGHRVEIAAPRRGPKHALLELVERNARHSFEQRFRVLKPSPRAIAEALESALNLPEPPRRIECFDVSHLQGADTVASMVVWENNRMKKSDYRKFIIRHEFGNDDFASLREAVTRRYRRLLEEKKPLPSLILVDGGVGQLHAAAEALESLEIINQPLASIAKKEEVIYVHGQENEPVVLDRHSPILHLIQQVRDESHRFAVTFHRQRRAARTLRSELLEIPGVGEASVRKLLSRFGSLAQLQRAGEEEMAAVVPRAIARRVHAHLHSGEAARTDREPAARP
jgi:excinuclease ABC subunit C